MDALDGMPPDGEFHSDGPARPITSDPKQTGRTVLQCNTIRKILTISFVFHLLAVNKV